MDGMPFGRYRLVELLGRGGMGEVWRAFDTATSRVVAVKVLAEHLASDPIFEQRFRREALAAAGLNEPHVVPIHNFGEINGRLYVDMRLIEGRDLEALLADGPLEPGRAVSIIEQIASALHAAHRIGLVHRDVKPSNILVSEDDFSYLIDFGIARAAGQTGLTSTGNMIGTWAYLAPERLTTGQTDARADIYALACVLHECLTSSQPFPGNSLEQQVAAHLAMPPPRPSVVRDTVPTELDPVIARGMAKNPDQRYSTTKELAKAARAAITVPATRPIPRMPARPVHHVEPQPGPHAQPTDVVNRDGPAYRGVSPVAPTQFQPPSNPQLRPPSNPQLRPPSNPQFQPASNPQLSWQRADYTPAPPAVGFHPPPPGSVAEKPKSGKGFGKVIAAVLVVIAIVAAVVVYLVMNYNEPGKEPIASPTSSVPSNEVANTGPFTGVFTADLAAETSLRGKARENSPAATEIFALRSECRSSGCVAAASRLNGATTHQQKLTFDDIGGRWIAVATMKSKCASVDVEGWQIITLQPNADGTTLTGDYLYLDPQGCTERRLLTFKRTRDVTAADGVEDPSGIQARVVSPAQALHGRYRYTRSFPNGKPQDHDVAVRTDCLRTQERCMSFFNGDTAIIPLVFSNGKWLEDETFDGTCPSGGTSHVVIKAEFPLPQPPQDPISELTGHGHQDSSGSACVGTDFDGKFVRQGD